MVRVGRMRELEREGAGLRQLVNIIFDVQNVQMVGLGYGEWQQTVGHG